jgi:hypothetical protein
MVKGRISRRATEGLFRSRALKAGITFKDGRRLASTMARRNQLVK